MSLTDMELLRIYKWIVDNSGVNECLSELNGIGNPYTELWSAESAELENICLNP